jgi:hypothetical protein
MLVDPNGRRRWLKMALGENPKRVYGDHDRMVCLCVQSYHSSP